MFDKCIFYMHQFDIIGLLRYQRLFVFFSPGISIESIDIFFLSGGGIVQWSG